MIQVPCTRYTIQVPYNRMIQQNGIIKIKFCPFRTDIIPQTQQHTGTRYIIQECIIVLVLMENLDYELHRILKCFFFSYKYQRYTITISAGITAVKIGTIFIVCTISHVGTQHTICPLPTRMCGYSNWLPTN